MGKLTDAQVDEYFAIHLPYRTRILVAHYWMTRTPWTGNVAWLQACFEASLITGRMYLNVLGISKNNRDELVRSGFRDDDVSAEDLGGKLVDLGALTDSDKDLFIGFLKMADKGAAHLTIPMKHPWENTHAAVSRICYYLKTHLYAPAGRTLKEAAPLPLDSRSSA